MSEQENKIEDLPEQIETTNEPPPTKTKKPITPGTFRTIKKRKIKSIRKETRNERIKNKSKTTTNRRSKIKCYEI
jgi:hypothetical protein